MADKSNFTAHLGGVKWCLRERAAIQMVAKAKRSAKTKRGAGKSVRTSVTLPREVYETLAQLAKSKKVTVAWVIRDAAEKYVGDAWPLLAQSKTT